MRIAIRDKGSLGKQVRLKCLDPSLRVRGFSKFPHAAFRIEMGDEALNAGMHVAEAQQP